MPYAYLFQCPGCEFDVELIGAKEFTLTPEGERVDYVYPDPDTYEWPVKRVSGLWNHVWCPACKAIRHLIIAELPEPAYPLTMGTLRDDRHSAMPLPVNDVTMSTGWSWVKNSHAACSWVARSCEEFASIA